MLILQKLFNQFFHHSKSLIFGLGFFLSACSGIFYQPDRIEYATPTQFKIDYESFYFQTTPLSPKLHGWKLYRSDRKQRSKGTFLLFHGNAQNLTSHFFSLAWMTKQGYDVMIYDYRGYGKSEGIPELRTTHQDALTALKEGYQFSIENNSPFFVMGQSLGGNIALRAIYDFPLKDKIKLLIIDSSFLSYQKMVWDKLTMAWILYPFSPLAYILYSDEFSSGTIIDKLPSIPTLVIHGKKDFIVPLKFGQEIYQRLKAPKWIWEVEQGMHIDAFFIKEPDYRAKFITFLETFK